MTEVEEAWQQVVGKLLDLKTAWGEFQDIHGAQRSFDGLSIQAQHLFGLSTMRSEFSTFLERILDYARRNGGLEFLVLPEPEEPVEEEEEELEEDEDDLINSLLDDDEEKD